MAKKAAPTTDPKNQLRFKLSDWPGMTAERAEAEIALSPLYTNAQTARMFTAGTFGNSDFTSCALALQDKAAKAQVGDLSGMEAMLVAQATALDAIFTEMARRAALNMNEHLAPTDTYMRLALKAQSQCRTTIEALAEIKAPRHVAFVKQANIAHGAQQVNNGIPPPHAGETINQSNELSGGGNELLPDTRAPSLAGRIDTRVEAVGEIYRATD